MTFSESKIRDMYALAQREIAEVWNAPHVLDLPLVFQSFSEIGYGEMLAVTNYDEWTDKPTDISYNTDSLPRMVEDEIRYGLFHELTHAVLPWGAHHGPEFVDAVSYTTGVAAPFVTLRYDHPDGRFTLDNPPKPGEAEAVMAEREAQQANIEDVLRELSKLFGFDGAFSDDYTDDDGYED